MTLLPTTIYLLMAIMHKFQHDDRHPVAQNTETTDAKKQTISENTKKRVQRENLIPIIKVSLREQYTGRAVKKDSPNNAPVKKEIKWLCFHRCREQVNLDNYYTFESKFGIFSYLFFLRILELWEFVFFFLEEFWSFESCFFLKNFGALEVLYFQFNCFSVSLRFSQESTNGVGWCSNCRHAKVSDGQIDDEGVAGVMEGAHDEHRPDDLSNAKWCLSELYLDWTNFRLIFDWSCMIIREITSSWFS